MRFVVQHKKANYINFLVIMFSIGMYFFLVSFLLFKCYSEEFFPEQILKSIKGSPEEFLEPKTLRAIIEGIHIESFLLIISALSIFSIFIRTTLRPKFKIFTIFVSFFCILVYFSSILALKFVSIIFSYIYSVSLIGIFILLFTINTFNIYSFSRGKIL